MPFAGTEYFFWQIQCQKPAIGHKKMFSCKSSRWLKYGKAINADDFKARSMDIFCFLLAQQFL